MTRPPVAARTLLEQLLPPADREFVLGDLEEAFAARVAGAGLRTARRWYWKETCHLLARRAWRRSRAPVRTRSATGDHVMRIALQDLRHQLRQLRAQPALTLTIVATLALGVGLSTAMFSVVSRVLLRPLPYDDADRLVAVWEEHPSRGDGRVELSPANFLDLKDRNGVFENLTAFTTASLTLVGVGEPEVLDGLRVSWSYFATIGVTPLRGRVLELADDLPNAEPVVVLSHRFWQARFNGDGSVIGRALMLDGRATTVVGVTPPGFAPPGSDAAFFVPASLASDPGSRGAHFLYAIGRLKHGVTRAQADADLDRIAAALAREYPRANEGLGIAVVDLREQLVGDVRPALLVLFAAVTLVLIIACVNVANLLLAQSLGREGELSIRVALGAGPWRLLMQLLTESLALAAAGGILGVVLSVGLVRLLNVLVPETFVMLSGGRAVTMSIAGTSQTMAVIDWRVLLFAAGSAVATGVLFGVAPAWRARRTALVGGLKETGRTGRGSKRQRRLRELLIVAELAVALILAVGAGLLIRSVAQLQRVDPGFDPAHVLAMRTVLPVDKYSDADARRTFYDRVLERVAAVPGVKSASYATFLPLTFAGLGGGVAVHTPAADVSALYRVIGPDYFATLGVPLIEGRTFQRADGPSAARVAIVSHAFARRSWGDDPAAAIGRQIKPLSSRDSTDPWVTVVGVVGDVRQTAMDAEPVAGVYTPYTQGAPFTFAQPRDLAVRAHGDAMSVASAVRAAIRTVDPEQPVSDPRPMTRIVEGSAAGRRVYMYLLASFACLALALAAFGVYGVMAYLVSSRTSEMAVRLALGAHPSQVRRLILADSAKLTATGLVVGALGALGSVRVLERILYDVAPFDATSFVSAFVVLAAAALTASVVPAWRATRIDPVLALRAE